MHPRTTYLAGLLMLCALGGGASAGPMAAVSPRPVRVAQASGDLEDKPAPSSPTAAPAKPADSPFPSEAIPGSPTPAETAAATKAAEAAAKEQAKATWQDTVKKMVKNAAFWALLAGTLLFGYALAWMVAQVSYTRSHPLSAISAARVGVGMGLLMSPILPIAYVWRTGQPWLWAFVLAIPFFVCALVVLLSRSEAV
ncbi:MAG TPA: hypothetical protein VGM37_05915 [Armatimonadota bacterium]|jgi:Na+/melibiose symporter-like transporter